MDRQEEYEKVKSDSWGKCVLDGRLTKELVEEVFDTAYNIGKKHARGNDGMVSVSIDVVKTMYDEAKKTCSIFTKATCINAIESENLDKAMGAVDVLEKLFGESILDIKHVKEKRVEALNLKGLDQASVIERGLTYLEENGKPVCVCYEGESKIRLQVATAAMQGILSNEKQVCFACEQSMAEEVPLSVSEYAVACADALIAEVSKKGGEGL